jgi:hypothetical protein
MSWPAADRRLFSLFSLWPLAEPALQQQLLRVTKNYFGHKRLHFWWRLWLCCALGGSSSGAGMNGTERVAIPEDLNHVFVLRQVGKNLR